MEKGKNRRDFLKLGAGTAAGLAGGSMLASGAGAQPGPPPGPPPGRGRRVRTGVEVLLEGRLDLLSGKRVGVITNPTGILPDLSHVVDALAAEALAAEANLVAIFAPEHGFRGEAQAGESGGEYADPRTGIAVYDIYGQTAEEIAATFDEAGVDAVLFDIQDAGARFYTYIWTMSDALEASAIGGAEIIVLDRPNPLSGDDAFGPVLEPRYSTFVGRYEIPQIHGMTVAELAGMFNEEFVPERTEGGKANLSVVEMEGWSRGMYFEDTGLPWAPPSPNMPTVETAVVYPGTGMLEGTNLSEGRGTTKPFELLGAPYIDFKLADALRGKAIPGAEFREAYFAPTFSKHAGETVGGVQVYVADRAAFDPLTAALEIIVGTKNLYPDGFEWRFDDYDPETPYWIDKLTGSSNVRTSVDAGMSAQEVASGWEPELNEFRRMRSRHLIYEGRPAPPGKPSGPKG